ncbi:hypothetical protein VB715_17755 [Crocosphaera sp. UHCC 0190]|uniref:hypothetical protein n=1 Tax=Crocosphaera sp. UHCC 0190 TaxID=3110246 RepID=UPI002B1F4E38|nr:hypothetical protein [Crocosphaera sp. UHCC 0190]MEA5511622.1 hypothetical protein [Crocosphaera sp. UHCC 0190]
MKVNVSGLSLGVVSLLFTSLNLSAQLRAESNPNNLDDLPNDPGQMLSWTCNYQEDGILVEAKNDKIWKDIIEKKDWNCQQGLSDTPTGTLKFTCEPTDDGIISLLTITWLQGTDENRLMGQWIHQFADEYNMICRMAKVDFWDQDITTP